jgi:hypothetical protein
MNFLKRLLCWFEGHDKAEKHVVSNYRIAKLFYCRRCDKRLFGPVGLED